ncbi:glycosyltransferase family 2 protein [Solicola gregarius]|uniref:Glycosyltransferase n=1 Tax=Solicola gregarius TaxID=2908642 RepID=A0AA46TKW0_9ACTN|nr:glycosyltransferase family 2 protein [Solicola gregarius]UYM06993.1 glycosyltransferase [Solicola gregarius]
MTTRWTPRRIATGIGRRAKRLATAGSPETAGVPPTRSSPPAVSVILPIYNVENYLRECLDSVLAQRGGDLEVIVVDDGSPDRSADIAAEYAARDRRVRLVSRPNGGLGAARNTGLEHATGEYVAFVDSDDRLPPGALAAMLASARTSGSDMVVGSARRFSTTSVWKPTWVDDLHDRTRTGITIDDFPALVRNNYTWGKLYRRTFLTAQEATFREGVSYEDQPLITRLYIAASAIDVLPDVAYEYRAREDASSISQQTASLSDLRDRVSAWQESRREFAETASRAVYDAWLQTLFDAHFHWYLSSPGTVDLAYWATLRSAIVDLTDRAPQAIWDATPPERRVPIELARRNRRADVQEFVRCDGYLPQLFPATVVDGGVRHDLPFHDDPELDAALFVRRPEQLRLSHSVQRFSWADGSTMKIAGWAYIRHIDLVGRDVETTLVLRNERTGAEHTFASVGHDDPGFPPPDEDAWVDYHGGEFEFAVPMDEVVGANRRDGDVWHIRLRVSSLGFTVEDTVSRVRRSSSSGVPYSGELSNGDLITVMWRLHAPFRLGLRSLRVEAVDVALAGRSLRGTLSGPEANWVREVQIRSEAGSTLRAHGGSRRCVHPSGPARRPQRGGARRTAPVSGRRNARVRRGRPARPAQRTRDRRRRGPAGQRTRGRMHPAGRARARRVAARRVRRLRRGLGRRGCARHRPGTRTERRDHRGPAEEQEDRDPKQADPHRRRAVRRRSSAAQRRVPLRRPPVAGGDPRHDRRGARLRLRRADDGAAVGVSRVERCVAPTCPVA